MPHDPQEILAQYETELREIEAEIRTATTRRDAIRQIVAGLRLYTNAKVEPTPTRPGLFELPPVASNGQSAPKAPPLLGTPKGRDAVRIILEDAKGDPVTIEEIVREAVERRGWMTDVANPHAALAAAANRLVADGVAHRPERGVFVIPIIRNIPEAGGY